MVEAVKRGLDRSRECRRWVEQRFSVDRMVDDYEGDLPSSCLFGSGATPGKTRGVKAESPDARGAAGYPMEGFASAEEFLARRREADRHAAA